MSQRRTQRNAIPSNRPTVWLSGGRGGAALASASDVTRASSAPATCWVPQRPMRPRRKHRNSTSDRQIADSIGNVTDLRLWRDIQLV
jgi:hypothetical protein